MADGKNKRKRLAISFVHGYENLGLVLEGKHLPALWVYDLESGHEQVVRYPFPRNPDDFRFSDTLMAGAAPLPDACAFQSLPRFGLTGLSSHGGMLYAGSWNGVYEIDAETLELQRIVTIPLMSDLHGIWADEDGIWGVLTCQDTLFLAGYDGEIKKTWSISGDLCVTPYSGESVDWRFVSKQFRGSCGLFHFNYIQRRGNEIWLTSRSCNALVVLNLDTETVRLRLMNTCTPTLLHDGKQVDGKIHFTSIDGKIITAEESAGSGKGLMEEVSQQKLYRRDLATTLLRLEETEFGREPNWCRGFERVEDVNYVTVDGRYGSDLSFGLVGVRDTGEMTVERRLRWKDVGDERELRYVTGFDILHLD